MAELPVIPDKKLDINSDSEAIKRVAKAIREAASQLSFLATVIETGNAGTRDVNTHISLLKSDMENLSKELELDAVRQLEDDMLTQVIRQQSKEIRDFSSKIGEVLTAEQFTHAMRYYEDKFQKWYESLGFEYASVDLHRYCLQADFSTDINGEIARERIPGIVLTDKPFLQEVVDCDENRRILRQTFAGYFPKVRFREFTSRVADDKETFALRVSVLVDYSDIQALEQ